MDTNERTIKLRAGILRAKLLRGVKPGSTMFQIVNELSDATLCEKDDAAAREKAAWASSKCNERAS
jgi:hypothetical protein